METSAPGVPKGPVPRLVPHKSLAERAYDILEEAIVTLELAPGSIISEQELSELTGIGQEQALCLGVRARRRVGDPARPGLVRAPGQARPAGGAGHRLRA